MLVRLLLGILLSLVWFLLLRAGWICCIRPARAQSWMDEYLEFSSSWQRLFMAEDADRLMVIRFQGVALLFLMLFLALELGPAWLRLVRP
jgi:hypothetical protein